MFFWILSAATVVLMLLELFLIDTEENAVGTFGGILEIILLIPMIGSIFVTEKELKNAFDENGKRRR